jgi:hypothetical protein
MGNLALLAGPASLATRIIAHDVMARNAVFATIQLALAAGLLWRRTARAALCGTVGWAVAVWLLGRRRRRPAVPDGRDGGRGGLLAVPATMDM